MKIHKNAGTNKNRVCINEGWRSQVGSPLFPLLFEKITTDELKFHTGYKGYFTK